MDPLAKFQDALIAQRVVRRVMGFEHDSEEARKKYLHEHPKAEPRNHTVKKQKDQKKYDDGRNRTQAEYGFDHMDAETFAGEMWKELPGKKEWDNDHDMLRLEDGRMLSFEQSWDHENRSYSTWVVKVRDSERNPESASGAEYLLKDKLPDIKGRSIAELIERIEKPKKKKPKEDADAKARGEVIKTKAKAFRAMSQKRLKSALLEEFKDAKWDKTHGMIELKDGRMLHLTRSSDTWVVKVRESRKKFKGGRVLGDHLPDIKAQHLGDLFSKVRQ